MDESERSAGQREPWRPEFKDPSSAWRWWGFILIILGVAGLLFHRVWDIPVLNTWEGKAAVGALAAGIGLTLISYLRRRNSAA